MTADDRNDRREAQHIRVIKDAREAVLKDGKADKIQLAELKLEMNAEQQTEKARQIKERRQHNDDLRDDIQLRAEIKLRLRVHAVEDAEADQHVQEHDEAEQQRIGDVEQNRNQRAYQKRPDPDAEAHARKGFVAPLVEINQPQSPDKQGHQQHIGEYLYKGDHAEE